MGPSCRTWVNAAFLAFLAGCASGKWEKESATPSQRDRDLAECRAEASAGVDRDIAIDSDILASRGQDWSRTGVIEQRRTSMRAQTRGRADEIVARCMAGRGYARVS